MKRPSVLYPTLVKGIIRGPIRYESLDGSQMYGPEREGNLRIPPFEMDGKMWCVSHIQKKAKYFSLTFDPFIYHFGKFWHLQETFIDGNGVEIYKPGTEQGIYFRTPGWRWQRPDQRSNWTPWIWSWGRVPGTHLD